MWMARARPLGSAPYSIQTTGQRRTAAWGRGVSPATWAASAGKWCGHARPWRTAIPINGWERLAGPGTVTSGAN